MALTREASDYSILIADDDEGSRTTLRDIVEPEGFRTVLAANGEEAVDIVQSRPVHLLVCDMYMPRLSGLETLQLVHRINMLLPCILISGNVDDDLMRRALTVKAYSVLSKPVSKPMLLYMVAKALERVYESQS